MEDKIRKWMEKVNTSGSDLSKDEDLSLAIMNLISLEEHSYFTAIKTGNSKYFEIMNSIRELRKTLLKRIVKEPKGEEWCMSKHLLAASMRLIEVGTKENANANKKDAEMMFNSAFNLYSLFFAINLKLIDKEEISNEQNKSSKFSEIIKKIVDCCKE